MWYSVIYNRIDIVYRERERERERKRERKREREREKEKEREWEWYFCLWLFVENNFGYPSGPRASINANETRTLTEK